MAVYYGLVLENGDNVVNGVIGSDGRELKDGKLRDLSKQFFPRRVKKDGAWKNLRKGRLQSERGACSSMLWRVLKKTTFFEGAPAELWRDDLSG